MIKELSMCFVSEQIRRKFDTNHYKVDTSGNKLSNREERKTGKIETADLIFILLFASRVTTSDFCA